MRIMKSALSSRKRRVGALAVTLLLLMAGGALAYVLLYTGATGTITQSVPSTLGNSGDAQVSSALTISGTPNIATGIADGSDSETGSECQASFSPGCKYNVPITVTNVTPNLTAETLVSATSTLTVDSTHATAGCQASWFTFTAPSALTNYAMPAGTTSQTLASNGTLDFTDASANQTACAGATLSIKFTGTTNP